jgi:lipoprotein-anchoring transpeptidase ErfK/SrfK
MDPKGISMAGRFRMSLLLVLLALGSGLAACSRDGGVASREGTSATAAPAGAGSDETSPIVQVSNPSPATPSAPGDDSGSAAAKPAGDTLALAGTSASAVAADPATTGVAGRATSEAGLRILVSIAKRRLWLVDGADTLLRARVAIGMGKDFTYEGRKYHFATPRGTRKVLAKAKDPLWIVPEWHYYEKAAAMGIDEVVRLEDDATIVLGDSSILTIREHEVGRINQFGNFAPFTPGTEIIFDGRMYIPPVSTVQRKVPNALGPYKLDMGDGYLIHGTHLYNEESIGDAVSHGCVRMTNEDLARLYPLVPRGTPVIIF